MSVAFNNASGVIRSATNSFSNAVSVTAGGSNLCAFAMVAFDHSASASITAITYGGNTMTSAGPASQNTSSNAYTQIFYLVNPPTGSNTLAITGDANVNEIYANLVSFTGVDQTTPVRSGTYNTATGNSASASVTISSNASDLTIAVQDGGPSAGQTTTNQTEDGTNNGGSYSGGSDHATTASASNTHTRTLGGTSQWAVCGLSVQADGSSSSSADTLMLSGCGL